MTKHISLLLGTLFLVVAEAQAQSPYSWKLYTAKDEDFSVSLPNHPAMLTSKEQREPPEKDRRRRILRCANSGVAYTIFVVENPKPRQSLDGFIQEQTPSDPPLILTAPRAIIIDGIPGKSFDYSDKKGMVQFFATEDRLYGFRAYGADLDDARIIQFFSSLSLKRKDTTIVVYDGPGAFFESKPLDVFKGTDVDSKVRLQSKPKPEYTAEADNHGIYGTVILRCIFTSKGTVTNFYVIKGLPAGLTEKSIEAARQIRFTPATKDGKPVSMWMQLEYNFKLR